MAHSEYGFSLIALVLFKKLVHMKWGYLLRHRHFYWLDRLACIAVLNMKKMRREEDKNKLKYEQERVLFEYKFILYNEDDNDGQPWEH